MSRPVASSTLPFEVKSLDDSARTFSGLAAAFSTDLGGDVILPGAFKRTLKDWKSSKGRVIPLLDSHNRMSVRAVVGKMEEAEETQDGLLATFSVIEGPDGEEIYRRVKGGYVSGLSIGFRAIREKAPTEQEQRSGIWRFLEEIKLEEVSTVIFGMNPDALIDLRSVKGLLELSDPELAAQFRQAMSKQFPALSSKDSGGHPPALDEGLATDHPRRLQIEATMREITLRGLGA